jgi:hypothetical protein
MGCFMEYYSIKAESLLMERGGYLGLLEIALMEQRLDCGWTKSKEALEPFGRIGECGCVQHGGETLPQNLIFVYEFIQ